MDKKLAFVFSGGGSRGALQVGALYALLEQGLEPDMLIGASIGAVNAAFIALNGFSKASLELLTSAWHAASASDLMAANYIWLTVRAMFKRSSTDPSQRLRNFFIKQGLTPELCFSDLTRHQLVVISADLNSGKPVLHGTVPDEKILDAVLLSTTLPPWFMPVRKQNRYLVDGAIVSNLPVEPALNQGASRIVAMDLVDSRELADEGDGVMGFLNRLVYSVERRQLELELELAEARGVPLLYLALGVEVLVPIWDFSRTDDLIDRGYDLTKKVIESQQLTHPILADGG
jgi:NTE family protein